MHKDRNRVREAEREAKRILGSQIREFLRA